MSLEHMAEQEGVAVAEKSTEASVLINPEAEIPGSTTTRVQKLVKPPSNIWGRFLSGSGAQTPEEESPVEEVEEQTTPVSESEPSAGGAGNGSEGRDGDGGGDGGGSEGSGGPEIIGGPEKGESPGSIRDKLVTIDTMTAEQREANAGVSGQYCELLTDYANGNQAIQENHEITTLRKQLINTDQAYIDQKYASDPDSTVEEKEELELSKRALKQLFNDLDEAELKLQEYEDTLAVRDEAARAGKEHQWFSKKGWQKQEEERDRFAARVEAIKGEIADEDFLDSRAVQKTEIETKIEDIKKRAEEREEEEKNKILAKLSELEEGLKEKDKPIEFTEAEVASLPKFSEVLERLETQEELRRVKDPNFNESVYNQSKEVVGWYFQEARDLGMLFDLDQDLDSDFEDYMVSLHFKPVDERRLPPPKMTISELRNSIRGKLQGGINRDGLRVPGRAEVVESDEVWKDDLADTVRFSTTRTRQQFEGVRTEYLTRGYEQMRASFTNLIHLQSRLKLQTDLIRERITDTEYADKVARIPTDTQRNYRVYGEWNFGFESEVRQQLVERILAEQARPLFHETDFGFFVLEGENSREIELAAEQAAEFITGSAGAYSLEAVQQRREYLLRAIENKRSVLSAETGGIKSKTDVLVDRIKQVALNKLDFFILQWLADNLRMPEYSSYFEQTVMQKGTDRLKVVPTMSDGLVGLAIRYLLMPEYRLFFQPGGFKNQLGESDPQSYLRKLLQEGLVDTLMGFELDDQGKGWEGKAKTLQDLMKVQSTDQFLKYFKQHNKLDSETEADPISQHPAERLKRAEAAYDAALEKANAAPKDPEALIRLREAGDLRAFEHSRFQTVENRVKNAVDEAIRVMDITGESAKLGAPMILMGKEDYISVDEVTLFYKFAILQVGKDYGQNNGMEDNQALIRWRAQSWIDRWKKAGLDRTKASGEFDAGGEDGNKLKVSLKEGWEETGLTAEEWSAFENAAKQLRENGYNAKLKVKTRQKDGSYKEEEMRFEDIIKRPELQPVLNNFLADYKSSKDQIQDDYLRTQAFKGRLGTLKNILVRLGMKKPTGKHQKVMNEYTQAIEDSRAFHAEVGRLAYYEATHASLEKVKQQNQQSRRTIYMDSAFLEDRLDYGYQGLSWGIKRAQRRQAFEYTNLRRTAPRAVDLIHAIPISLTSLSQESASDDILNMFWDLNRFQKDDNWTLMTFAMRTKDAWYIGGRLEGDMPEQGGKLGKDWGFLEKPMLDINNLWDAFQAAGIIDLKEFLKRLGQGESELTKDFKENVVKRLWDGSGGHLGRFAPIVIGAHKQLAEDRQALGSGAGYEEGEKFALRFLEWLLSEKIASLEHGAREEGGQKAYAEVADIIRMITTPGSYDAVYKIINNKPVLDLEKSSSIWDEVWRKLTPGHNPRLPRTAPSPNYLALAA